MKNASVIIKKELFRVFGDKKMIFSLFLLPAVIVIGIYSLMGVMVDNLNNDIETHIPSVYLVNAPENVQTLIAQTGYDQQANLTFWDVNTSNLAAQQETVKADILSGAAELMVEFDPQFTEKVAAYQAQGDLIPTVTYYYNTTGNYSSVAKNAFFELVMKPYETLLLQERLGNLELLTVYAPQEVVIVDEDKANGEMFAMLLPYLITFLLFASAMSLCVDAIAGEKERGTMASLLLTPMKRSELVFGKIVALSILASISAMVYAVSMALAMPMMMKSMTGGADINLNVSFSFGQIISLILILVTLVYLYVALISLVAVVAKNVKEASTYVTPLYIVVLLAGMITMFQGGTQRSDILHIVPVYGTALSVQNLMTNELSSLQLGYSLLGNVLLAILLTFCITKAFNNEKIMFNA